MEKQFYMGYRKVFNCKGVCDENRNIGGDQIRGTESEGYTTK